MENPEFLKQKYNLHTAPEVEKAAERTEQQTDEKVPQDPASRIQNYLDRLESLALDPDKEQERKLFHGEPRPRALSLLREMVMNKYVRPNKDKLAEGAARVEERAARELGMDVQYGEQELEQRGDIAVEDLEKSLDNWISYLSDANEPYPTWFRYYVFRNVLDMGDYDKDKQEFTKRSAGSTRLFPDIDRGALAYVEQMIEASKDPAILERIRTGQQSVGTPENELLTKEKAATFAKLSFAKQYAEAIKTAGEITPEMREDTTGEWVKYQQGTDPTTLWASLQNKGVSWCTKGFATAETQLKRGDFYVYYTHDAQGKPTIPRIAIRMQGDQIGEVRGAADNEQNLEGGMASIAEEKMKDLPGSERYMKASADMKRLTQIEKKTRDTQSLTKDELVFLYEMDGAIEGFGYQKDPRIAELRSHRNPTEDMPIIFDCTPDQIATSADQITENTKAYVGALTPGIFDKIQEYNIEYIYTAFPEGRIQIEKDFEVGPLSLEDFERKATEYNRTVTDESLKIKVGDYAKDMFQKLGTKECPALKETEKLSLVRLTVDGLFGDTRTHAADEIYARAENLGLELCPPEVGPMKRLQDTKQHMYDWYRIAMRQIPDRLGGPRVFSVERDNDGLWLHDRWTPPEDGCDPEFQFMFRLRPSTYDQGRQK